MVSSPTPSPPLGTEQTDAELKLSRKREREVSLEPVSTPSSAQDIDASRRERKDSRTPAKKNRRRLDTTAEEDDSAGAAPRSRSNSVSPPLTVSPRQEMRIKVRQISQGVGDLNWRSMQRRNDDVDEEMPDESDNPSQIADSQQEQRPLRGGHNLLEDAVEIDADEENKDANASIVTDQHPHDAIVVDAAHEDANSTPPKTPDASQMTQSLPNIVETRALAAAPTLEVVTDGTNPTGGAHLAVTSDSTLRSDSESATEKGLKRKFLERGTSQGPPEPSVAWAPANEEDEPATTQARGDDDKVHETKNPSPPPESRPNTERTSPPSPKVAKLSGFMAYASTSSPFANVKGTNVFASSSRATSGASTPNSGDHSIASTSAPKRSGFESFASSTPREKTPLFDSTPNVPKRSGFEAFTSAASPFANVARAKSPVLGGGGSTSPSRLGRAKSPVPRRNNSFSSSPFGSYATGGAQGFAAVHVPKRARGESPATSVFGRAASSGALGPSAFGKGGNAFATANDNEDSTVEDEDEEQPTTFGERLRAGRDNEEEAEDEDSQKMALEEQDVITGEEDEETIMQVRGKLFALDGATWKERGTGILRLNVKSQDGSSPRLVMRKDAVYTLLLNVTLFPGMRCVLAQDPRYVRFGVIEDGKTTSYNLRMANAKIAQEFLEEVNANIPPA